MRQRTTWIVSFLLVIAILLLWSLSAQDHERLIYSPETVAEDRDPAQPAGDLRREEALPDAPLVQAEVQAGIECMLVSQPLGAEVLDSGVARASVLSPDSRSVVISAPVTAGRFTLPQDLANALCRRNYQAWGLVFNGLGLGASAASEFEVREVGGKTIIIFQLPSPRIIELEVVNLRGDPVRDAVVDCDPATGWVLWAGRQTKTDETGKATLKAFSDATVLALRVEKPGYSTERFTLEAGTDFARVVIRRIFATCIVQSEKVVMAAQGNVSLAGGVTFSFRDDDCAALSAKHAQGYALNDGESLLWEYYGERTWTEQAVNRIDYGDWFGGYLGSMTVELWPLDTEPFPITRVPEAITSQATSLHEIHFLVNAADQFWADPPQFIQLKVKPNDGEHAVRMPFTANGEKMFPVSPKRLKGTRYRAFLPIGEFVIMDSGWDWKPKLPYRDPHLASPVTINVQGSLDPQEVVIDLHPDERFVRQRFTNLHGEELDIEAILLPVDNTMPEIIVAFRATGGRRFLERFVRPGEYQVWIYHPARGGSVRYSTPFTWNGVRQNEGMWDIPIDLSVLDPTLIMR